MENKAFTLIELLVVISIIAIMGAITLPNYKLGDGRLALQRSTHKLAQDLRRAQELAISVKEFNGSVPYGYGVYFNSNQLDTYIIFADLNNDKIYSGINEKVEEITLEKNTSLNITSSLNICFVPPNPIVFFDPDSQTVSISTKATEVPVTMSVQVNKAGLIAVQ